MYQVFGRALPRVNQIYQQGEVMNRKHKHEEFIRGWLDGREVDITVGDFSVRVGKLSDFDHATGEVRFARPKWQQDLIDAAKAGQVVEFRVNPSSRYGWVKLTYIDCHNESLLGRGQAHFRIKSNEVPQWRKALAQAVKDGKVVEAQIDRGWVESTLSVGQWLDPNFSLTLQYRIKTDPKPDLVRYTFVYASNTWEEPMFAELDLTRGKCHNLKIVFDGETGKPKSVFLLD